MVYAIPRGGVVLSVVIAKKLGLALDLIITRKIGHPKNPEFAVCIVGENLEAVCDEEGELEIDKAWLKKAIEDEKEEAIRRRRVYWGDREQPNVTGKTAIVVDDGVATGMTFLMALAEVKRLKPGRLIAAVPVLPLETLRRIEKVADEVVYLEADPNFAGAVSSYYDEFPQLSDDEVIRLLSEV